jgi:hypothetical protein
MPIDPRHVGRRYGPFRNAICAEHIRAFATVVSGGVPGYSWTAGGDPPPGSLDQEAADRSSDEALVAPAAPLPPPEPPFALACSDPELGLDLLRLLHAEQEFEHGAPVRPGDELTTVGEIVEIRSRGSLDFLTVRSETTNGAGERVLVGRWSAVVRG